MFIYHLQCTGDHTILWYSKKRLTIILNLAQDKIKFKQAEQVEPGLEYKVLSAEKC